MTVRSSEFGGSPYKLGDLRVLPSFGRPGFFIEDGQEWLRSGALRANTANAYANLLAVAPGYGVNFNVAADRLNAFSPPSSGGTPSHTRVRMYFTTAGRYVLAPPPNDIGSNPSFRHNTNLTGAGTAVQISTTACTGHCFHNGLVLFSTREGTANTGVKNFTTTLNNSSSGPTAQEYAGVESNGTNLAVAIARATASNNTNCIQTSVDGLSWTARTGTSGAIGSTTGMIGIHYSAPLNRFFKWGGSPGGGYGDTVILSAADGFTDTVAMAANNLYEPIPSGTLNAGMQHSAASTATATLIPVRRKADSMYGWLRTVDGTNWTFVSPFLDPNIRGINAYSATVLQDLQYDAQRTRLVAYTAGIVVNSGDIPAFFFSTDNGTTWQAGNAFDDVDTSVTKFLGFSFANGQDLAHVGAAASSATQYLYSYAASKFDAVPSYVGMVNTYAQVSGMTYHIRIK